MIAVETFFLTALLSAFIGLIALLSLARPRLPNRTRPDRAVANFALVAAVISLGSLLLYAQSPRESARLVYGPAFARL